MGIFGGFIRKVGSAIASGVKKVGSAIASGAKAAANGVKKLLHEFQVKISLKKLKDYMMRYPNGTMKNGNIFKKK